MKRFVHSMSLMLLLLVPSSFISASELVPEKLVLRADDNLGIIYSHQLKKNQTIYGLSKFFNTDLDKISSANPGVKLNTIKLNQQVNIPINTAMISSERNLSPKKSYIPVFYTVKAKDNLFRVAKVYFDQSIDNVMKINKLNSMELALGQKLLVGWYEYNPVYKQRLAWTKDGIEVNSTISIASADIFEESTGGTRTDIHKLPTTTLEDERNKSSKGDMVFQKVISSRDEVVHDYNGNVKLEEEHVETPENADNATESVEAVENTTEVLVNEEAESEVDVESEEGEKVLSSDPFENRNGIYIGDYADKPTVVSSKVRAQWNTKSKDKVNLFALHATAKPNTYIEIYNPMLDRKVIAKVVGNLPPKAFKKNVELIVSPKVAETLGAKDKKFFVKVRFIE